MRIPFNKLFAVSEHGINPKKPVQIGVYVLTPDVNGDGIKHVDLSRYVGMDAEVVTDQITHRRVIQGFYTNPGEHSATTSHSMDGTSYLKNNGRNP